ncbi:MAG: twin-arginine translocase subunit TatC [Kiritimatiellae bacterium]|nr:twin-arginine translocase subunit TatC [Kiritimatiellia bacterium]
MKQSPEDSHYDSSMSLEDHLDELRFRLIRIVIGVAVGLVVCLFFGSHIVGLIQHPYLEAVHSLQGIAATSDSAQSGTAAGSVMPEKYQLQTLSPAGGLLSYMKIVLVSGLLLSSPWVFYHIWMFIATGLYPKEKKFVYKAAPVSAGLFVFGALFFVLVVAPLSLTFLVNFNDRVLDLRSAFDFTEYVSFVTTLAFVFGIAFQMPLAIFFLNKAGLVSVTQLTTSRKYVLLGIVVVAAMATPPDVISQVTLALPLYLLFELGIILSRLSDMSNKN